MEITPPTHYDSLEVSPTASPEVIRAAYKSLIQRLHPDRNPGDPAAAARSVRVVEAYQVLSDPVTRAAYDFELRRQPRQCNPEVITPSLKRIPSSNSLGFLHVVLWALAALVLAWLLWMVWVESSRPFEITSPSRANPIDRDAPSSSRQTGRTLGDYLTGVDVTLGSVPGEPGMRLRIPSIGLVAGGFETERFIEFANRNRDYINHKLLARLNAADPLQLAGNRGDSYLRQFILDSLADIANTRRLIKNSTATTIAGHYGVADVLLPEGFSLEGRIPVQPSPASDVTYR